MAVEPLFPSADITSAALSHLEGSGSPTPESSPAPVVPAAPTAPTYPTPPQRVQTQPQPAVPGQQPAAQPVAEPVALDIDPNTTYRVKTVVNGVEQVELLTGTQVLARNMNHRSYTQKTQALQTDKRTLMEERQQIAQQRQAFQESQAILNDAGRLAVYIQAKFPHMTAGQVQAATQQVQAQAGIPAQPQAPPQLQLDPQALVNFQDVQQTVGQRVAELEAELGRRATAAETQAIQRIEERATRVAQETVAQTIAHLQTAHAVAGYDRQIDTHISQLIKDNPALAVVPELNDLLRFRVQNMNPQTVEEMLQGISSEALAIAEGLDAHYQQQNTAAVAAKAKLTTHGIAVPSGLTPTAPTSPASQPFAPGGKGNWKSLSAEVGAAVDALRSR